MITILVLLLAVFLTFFSPVRYGIHGDNKPCGENLETKYHYTAIEYFFLSDEKAPSDTQIGTCPYQYYESKTLGIECWTIAIFSGSVLALKKRSKN